MKILFSHSYFLCLDPKQEHNNLPYPPLGTILAAALLRQSGHTVQLFDSMFAQKPENIITQFTEFKPDLFVLYDDGFNYLTKMCLSNMREAAFEMQQIAHQFGCQVITSSSDASDHYEKYLDNGADYVLLGEAEYSLQELIQSMFLPKDQVLKIPGLVYKENDQVIKNSKRALLQNLDVLPMAAWDLIDMAKYKQSWRKRKGYFSINMATTRGCPFKCNWCAKPIYGNSYHMRSPQNVINEILFLKQQYSMDHIWFCDDIFGLKRSWLSEFSQLIIQNNLKIRFKIQSRADLLVQQSYVSDLQKAGCEEVWMGAESGSQKILDAMDKGTTVEQIKAARELLKQYQIKTAYFIQFGYLGESMRDINSTLMLITSTMPDDIGISISYPMQGTMFFEKVKDLMAVKQNWKDSDDLDPMFKSTYPTAFYKKLHRYTHYLYRFQLWKSVTNQYSIYNRLKKLKYNVLKTGYKVYLNGYLKIFLKHGETQGQLI